MVAAAAQSADQNVNRSGGLPIDCDLLETWIPIDSNNARLMFCQKQ